MWEAVAEFVSDNIGLVFVGTITLVQVAPIKINPWSWLANVVHRFLLGSIDRKLDAISDKVDKLEKKSEEKEAVQARTHILRFADELYNGEKHSKDYFDDILGDCDMYEKYCEHHPGFTNNRTKMSANLIKETYARLLEEHNFL